MPIETAFEVITADLSPITGTDRVPLLEATGRVLAEDVITRIPLPPFDHSAVDGYAIAACEAAGAPPYRFRVSGRLAAGGGIAHLRPGEALQVFTGAALPPSVIAVVPEERCLRADGTIAVINAIRDGANIRHRGEDVAEGSIVVESGSLLDARHIAILAATGRANVAVKRRIRVASLSSGSELRSPGETLTPHTIYDSNRPMLAALVARPWIELVDAGHLADDPEALASAYAALAHQADVVISTGGAAGSDADHTQRSIAAAGGIAQRFHLALRPGKPLVIGRIGEVPFVGLPGNPVAALVNFLLFGRALIFGRAGGHIRRPQGQAAVAATAFNHHPGRTEFVPAHVTGFDPQCRPILEKLGRGGSARLRPLVLADGLAEIPADAGDLPRGSPVAFHSFHAAFAT